MNTKEVNVNCSFCNREIPCPEDMIKLEKHSCYECFEKLGEGWDDAEFGKVHIAFPKDKAKEMIQESLMQHLMEEVFPKIWSDRKSEFKEMSKRGLAQDMFSAGAYLAIKALTEIDEKYKEKLRNE